MPGYIMSNCFLFQFPRYNAPLVPICQKVIYPGASAINFISALLRCIRVIMCCTMYKICAATCSVSLSHYEAP
jgi:hypothetical protein